MIGWLVLMACTMDSEIHRQSEVDVFLQEPTSEVDVLWVVDNSVSMASEQERVAAGFATFAASLEASNVEAHIGVISTDMEPDNPERAMLVGDPPVLERVLDADALFAERVQLGIDGSGKEKGIAAAIAAVSEPLVSGANAGFVRPDATLLLVFVSDEDDCSDGDALYDEPPEACYTQPEALVPVEDLHRELVEARAGAPVLAAGLLGPPGDTCPKAWHGARYEALIEATGGIVGDICTQDYAELFDALGLSVSEVRTVFQLSYAAVEETLEVAVGDELVPEDPVLGWTYDPDFALIRFDGKYVPPRGSTVSVTYEVGHGGSVPDAELD